MIRRKARPVGYIKDSNNRVYIAVKKISGLVIHITASEKDRINIRSYSENCITNTYNKKKGTASCMNTYFNSVAKYISEDFDKYNYEELHRFISGFVYAYRIKDLVLNSYNKFLKDNVLFSYLIEVDEIYENDKMYKYKNLK